MPTVSDLAGAAAALAEAARGGRKLRIGRELTLAGLDRVLEHEPGDLTCVVEAGIRLSALADALRPHGQRLALDPPGDPTVGACLADARSGPLGHRFGTPRDLVLGVTVVLADGTVASSGGKVVKNVAGYDLAKLFCGSRGTLGLIVRAAFRLHPLPAAARSLVVPVDDAGEAARLAALVRRSTLAPSAVDLDWPGRLCLLFEGSERAVGAQLGRAAALLGGEEGDPWPELRARQGGLPGRVAFPPGELARFLAGREAALVRVGAGSAYVPERVERRRSPLEERVRASFDPAGVLAG